MTVPAENRPLTSANTADPAPSGDLVPPPGPDLLPPAKPEHPQVARTRTSAVWMGIWAGVVVLVLLIVFIAQNTADVRISFFTLEGSIPLALALLIAGVAGAVIAGAVAAFRILQLRRQVRRGR